MDFDRNIVIQLSIYRLFSHDNVRKKFIEEHMEDGRKLTFRMYLGESAYWLGFKSPRWTLLLIPLVAILGSGLDAFLIGEVFVLALLYFYYRKEKKKKV